jgi:excisionase family DNA binding protein
VTPHFVDLPTGDHMTVDQAAKSSGLSESQIRGAIRRGRLPATRISSRCLLISRLDLAAWLSSPTEGS